MRRTFPLHRIIVTISSLAIFGLSFGVTTQAQSDGSPYSGYDVAHDHSDRRIICTDMARVLSAAPLRPAKRPPEGGLSANLIGAEDQAARSAVLLRRR